MGVKNQSIPHSCVCVFLLTFIQLTSDFVLLVCVHDNIMYVALVTGIVPVLIALIHLQGHGRVQSYCLCCNLHWEVVFRSVLSASRLGIRCSPEGMVVGSRSHTSVSGTENLEIGSKFSVISAQAKECKSP